MRVKSLKIATVEGVFVRVGQEFELADKVAKRYIDAGFVTEVTVEVAQPVEIAEPVEVAQPVEVAEPVAPKKGK